MTWWYGDDWFYYRRDVAEFPEPEAFFESEETLAELPTPVLHIHDVAKAEEFLDNFKVAHAERRRLRQFLDVLARYGVPRGLFNFFVSILNRARAKWIRYVALLGYDPYYYRIATFTRYCRLVLPVDKCVDIAYSVDGLLNTPTDAVE